MRRRLNHMLGETLCETGASGRDRDALDRAAGALHAALADAEGLPRADTLIMLGRTLHHIDALDGTPSRHDAAVAACAEAWDLYHAAGDMAGGERARMLHETLRT
jgi:hypothetical protein